MGSLGHLTLIWRGIVQHPDALEKNLVWREHASSQNGEVSLSRRAVHNLL